MKAEMLDNFADLSAWIPVASGQAELTITPESGPDGRAMRLDFDFKGGGGFVVARKVFALSLPQAYAIRFNLRGAAPANKFELKLSDPSGRNVWWFHREAFPFPQDWQALRIPSRQIEFAWGPAGGGPASQLGAIEFAIAAGPGGKGTVWIADLAIEDRSVHAPPRVRAASALAGHEPGFALDQAAPAGWRSEPGAEPQWFLLDFQETREYGGLIIDWEPGREARVFDVQISDDGADWRTVCSARQAQGGRGYLYLPEGASRYLKLNLHESAAGQGFGILALTVQPYEFSRSIDEFFQNVARHEPKGFYPKYLYREQTYWSPVGVVESVTRGIMNEEGMVEVDQGSFSLEPFLYGDGGLITWADVASGQALEQGWLPIPSALWRKDELALTTTAFASAAAGKPALYIRYRIENHGATLWQGCFFTALRPFQVTPPWQAFNNLGGVSPIRDVAWRADGIWVNGGKVVIPLTAPSRFGAAAFEQGAITRYLKTGDLPAQAQARDDFGYASAALGYDLDLPPGAVQDIYLAIPFGPVTPDAAGGLLPQELPGAALFESAVREWQAKLGMVDIRLPPAAQAFTETWKTAAAHILINRDGPALQPGPRRYTRCWIRDGATMAAALLRVGCAREAQDFIRWYAQFQAPDGAIPCAVDGNGPDWLAEHDSHGEFIYTVMECFRFTGDRALLAELWPAVLKAAAHIEALRRQRLGTGFQAPEKRACYGLLPESASHEGYLAHPVHAYWDDFWALRGVQDAAAIAETLGEPAQARRFADLSEALRETLYASIRVTMSERRIPYIPGSVEWADFDPTATANALTLLDELHHLPQDALAYTFDEYLAGFRKRHSGQMDWANYTPYEIRIIGALVRLGRRRDALELAEFFIGDRRPPPWNQWPEIAWRDPKAPGHLGDIPHTWIGAEYILACRSLFAFERAADQALVIAAGLSEAWLADGFEVGVTDLPTYYGNLGYRLRQVGADTWHLSLSGGLVRPPGGIILKPPLPRPLTQVEIDGRPGAAFDAESVTLDRCPAQVVMKT